MSRETKGKYEKNRNYSAQVKKSHILIGFSEFQEELGRARDFIVAIY